jgi:hypothetical protein
LQRRRRPVRGKHFARRHEQRPFWRVGDERRPPRWAP